MHADLHQWVGGAWGCNSNFDELTKRDPRTFPGRFLDWVGSNSYEVTAEQQRRERAAPRCRCRALPSPNPPPRL